MNSAEREIWASLASSLIVNSYFLNRIWGMFLDGTSTADNGMQIWAQTVLWLVPVVIVASITLTILVNIGYGILSGERSPIFLKDERDRKYELWGHGVTMAVMSMGFLLSLILLAVGYSGFIAFNAIYLTMIISDLAGTGLKLVLYRAAG